MRKETGYWLLVTRCWMQKKQDAGYEAQEQLTLKELDIGY